MKKIITIMLALIMAISTLTACGSPNAKEIEEEVYEVPDAGEQATTSLGSLFANIKLD